MKNGFIAHKDQERVQTVKEHSLGTAELARKNAISELKPLLFDAGLFHDIGKYQDDFQKRITDELNIRVDHSTAGAKEVQNFDAHLSKLILQYIIAGHHAGIPNGGIISDQPGESSSLRARLKKELQDYSKYKQDLQGDILPIDETAILRLMKDGLKNNEKDRLIDRFAFWVRYCFSCLVDADYLDTERFFQREERKGIKSNFVACLNKLNKRLNGFSCKTELQKARSIIQEQAYNNVDQDAEIYILDMPTGSGKTLCGTKCALMKAIKEKKKRIIYVIPYNSIINQTVKELKDSFGESVNILRHQSSYSVEFDEYVPEDMKKQIVQATENWDADIVVTTAVQFFETTFSNKPGKLRKMHNMADSVLVFDEAHLMPIEYFQPCLESISYLVKYCNSSAFFLTATMPDYEKLIKKYVMSDIRVCELIEDKAKYSIFQKCKFKDIGFVTSEELLKIIGTAPSALIVVNSRSKAKVLYESYGGINRKNLFHLSTHMTKFDIETTINQIHQALALSRQKKFDAPVIVISTSLIEAGVDLDFYTAFREYTGLDSVIQTGGRCNREGYVKYGQVYAFGFEEDKNRVEDVRVNTTRRLLSEYEDVTSLECVKSYYDIWYQFYESKMTEKAMHNQRGCFDLTSVPFADYNGELIKDMQKSIFIPEDEEARLYERELEYGGVSRGLLRKMQRYTCSVSLNEFNSLKEQGVLDDYGTEVYVLQNMDYYSDSIGIKTEGVDYFL